MKKQLRYFLFCIVLCVTAISPAYADWQQVGLAGFSAGEVFKPRLALDNTNTPYVAYIDGANGKKASVMRFDDTDWIQVGLAGFSPGEIDCPSLALDSSGLPYVAYMDGANGGKTSVMRFDGANWVQVGLAGFSPGQSFWPSLALDASDTPYIAYTDAVNKIKASVMRFDGTDWIQVGQAGFTASITFFPRLVLDSSSTPYVAYTDWDNIFEPTFRGTSVMRFDGTNWVQVGPQQFTPGETFWPSLSLDSNDLPYVAYVAYAEATSDWKISVMRFNGTDWVQVGLPRFSPDMTWPPHLALDDIDTPYVVYTDTANGNRASVVRFDGTDWVQVGQAGFTPGETDCLGFTVDSAGTPVVAYADGANGWKASVMKFASSLDSVSATLQEAIITVSALETSSFKKPNMQQALTNQLDATASLIDQAAYVEASDKLQQSILHKTDGCVTAEQPDKNDWLDCASQKQVYPLLLETIEYLEDVIQE